MQEMNLAVNSLLGTVPSGLGRLVQCFILNLSSNALTGTVPSSLSLLGSQLVIFNSSKLHETILYRNKTITLDLSRNGFTGTIPAALFSENMQTMSLYSNCFHGTLPAEICAATALETLLLDKLTGGRGCEFSVSLFNASFTRNLLDGSIPSCVWSLSLLRTLHLSGNGLQGTQGEVPPTSALTVVDLSNNFLSGPITKSMQSYPRFEQLILSGNKLSGTLLTSFAVSNMTNLSLSVNRLSGGIPTTFYTSSNLQLNVLNGNIFSCVNGDLPPNDPFHKGYVCRSNLLNQSLITWAVGFMVILLLALKLISFEPVLIVGGVYVHGDFRGHRNRVRAITMKWWNHYADTMSSTTSCGAFMDALERGRVALRRGACLVLTICAPLYVVLKSAVKGGTITEQYTWVISCAFLHGTAAATTVAMFVLLSVVGAAILVESMDSQASTRSSRDSEGVRSVSWGNRACRIAFQLVSMAVIFSINVAYVYLLYSNTISSNAIFVVQVALSIFKLAWKQFYINRTIKWMSSRDGVPQSTVGFLFDEFGMNVFNFVVGPYLATLGTDSRCMYRAIVGEKVTSSSFKVKSLITLCFFDTTLLGQTYEECVPFPHEQYLAISITPPWLYSYQCTSALLTNYVPVLLLIFTARGVVIPLLRYGALLVPDEYWTRLAAQREQQLNCKNFSAGMLKVSLLLDLAVLLTYGLAAPLLALAIVFKQITTAVYLRLCIGKSLSEASEQGLEAAMLTILEESAQQCGQVDWATLILMLVVVLPFWSAVVFDMVADVYGNGTGGVASLVVFLGWAAAACACRAVALRMRVKVQALKNTSNPETSLELPTHSQPAILDSAEVYNDLYVSGVFSGTNPEQLHSRASQPASARTTVSIA